MGSLRRPALAHPGVPAGLLEHVRAAGADPEIRSAVRGLVDRPAEADPARTARHRHAIGCFSFKTRRRPISMLAYIIRRILLMIPTLFGIMVVNFVIIQAAPG